MDNKINTLLQKFLEENNVQNIDEANDKIQEFINKYNNGEYGYEETALDKAYDILDEAYEEEDRNKAIKLAKKAYETSDECLDAIIFLSDIEENYEKKNKIIDEGLEYERKRLEKEGYFDKDNIGHFYGIFETRPYMRALEHKILLLTQQGKMTKAKELCKEALKLNENDNLGIRYTLMAVYALLEDEKEILKLYKKYPEQNLSMLFPLFTLYYKLDNRPVRQAILAK